MWGALVVALVLSLVLIPRTLAADRRARTEVERVVRADLERLIEDNPVSEWAPGVERFFELTTDRHVPPAVLASRDRGASR
jgi:hypothetical protein